MADASLPLWPLLFAWIRGALTSHCDRFPLSLVPCPRSNWVWDQLWGFLHELGRSPTEPERYAENRRGINSSHFRLLPWSCHRLISFPWRGLMESGFPSHRDLEAPEPHCWELLIPTMLISPLSSHVCLLRLRAPWISSTLARSSSLSLHTQRTYFTPKDLRQHL